MGGGGKGWYLTIYQYIGRELSSNRLAGPRGPDLGANPYRGPENKSYRRTDWRCPGTRTWAQPPVGAQKTNTQKSRYNVAKCILATLIPFFLSKLLGPTGPLEHNPQPACINSNALPSCTHSGKKSSFVFSIYFYCGIRKMCPETGSQGPSGEPG